MPEIAVAFRFVASQTDCLTHVSACVELEFDFRQIDMKVNRNIALYIIALIDSGKIPLKTV